MLSQTISTPTLGTATQNFTYVDGFNRLNTAQELNSSQQINWSQGYSYDNYGNQAVTSGYIAYPGQTPTALSQFVETVNGTSVNRNRWAAGSNYDSGGNMQSAPNQGFTYDAENRLVATTQPNSPAISYASDGNGNRVQKTVGTAVTTYVYDANDPPASFIGHAALFCEGTGSVRSMRARPPDSFRPGETPLPAAHRQSLSNRAGLVAVYLTV